jgi:hypothetical protein
MVAKGVQDLLICSEMLMAAIAFTFTFPVSDFLPELHAHAPAHPHQHLPQSHQPLHWQAEGALKGLADEQAGGGAPGMGVGVSLWSALWTSCVPLDVQEEFRQAAQQCRGEGECLTDLCWPVPCRCRIVCPLLSHRPIPHSPKKQAKTPRTPGSAPRGNSNSGGSLTSLATRRSF